MQKNLTKNNQIIQTYKHCSEDPQCNFVVFNTFLVDKYSCCCFRILQSKNFQVKYIDGLKKTIIVIVLLKSLHCTVATSVSTVKWLLMMFF